MSDSLHPAHADTLIAAAYLVTDENDPAYLAWKSDHPEAFAAGTWEPTRSTGRNEAGSEEAGSERAGREGESDQA